jgi:hypothetical protein
LGKEVLKKFLVSIWIGEESLEKGHRKGGTEKVHFAHFVGLHGSGSEIISSIWTCRSRWSEKPLK